MNPAPVGVERVFVGRVELLAPWIKAEFLAATSPTQLLHFGRFLDSFMAQLKQTHPNGPGLSQYTPAALRLYREAESKAGCVR